VNGPAAELHPVEHAWRRIAGGAAPEAVHDLAHKRGAVAVCAIRDADGDDWIAKRTGTHAARLEARLLGDLLPALQVPAPRLLGVVADGAHAWLFFEHLGGARYASSDPAHRRLAAQWIAHLHLASSGGLFLQDLPDRGVAWFEQLLAIACARLADLASGCRQPELRAALQPVVRGAERLREQWPWLTECVHGDSPVLVHGDLLTKNARIVHRTSQAGFAAFDWATTAGRGPAAVDLVQGFGRAVTPDLAAYARERGIAEDAARAMAPAGAAMRLARALDWAADSMEGGSGTALIPALQAYAEELEDLATAARGTRA